MVAICDTIYKTKRVAVPVYPHVKVEWSHVCTSPTATTGLLIAHILDHNIVSGSGGRVAAMSFI